MYFCLPELFSADRKEGGTGLASITRTVWKYDGDVGFRYCRAERTFTARIRLNLHLDRREGRREEETAVTCKYKKNTGGPSVWRAVKRKT